MSHFTIARLVAAGALVLAVGPLPYGYYTLLRLFVCGVSAYTAYAAHEWDLRVWVWVFGAVALVFNPLVPLRLDRSSWAVIDVMAAGLFLVSLANRALRTPPRR